MVIIHCLQCGKEEQANPSRIKIGRGKFCSKVHVRLYKKRYPDKGYWLGKKRIITPEWRAKISETTKNLTTENALKYRFKKNDPRITGKNNPNWANGITKLYQKIRNLWQYNDWQAQVRLRDNYTCQSCGKYLKILNERCSVDHYLKSFAQIIYDNNVTTVEKALLCNELWDINNGKTLCWPCHIKTPNYRRRIMRTPIEKA